MMIGLLLLSWTGLLQLPRDSLRLYAVGDINLGRRVAKQQLASGDTLYPFAALLDSLRAADITFGNLESPITPADDPVADAEFVFTAPPVAAAALARAGFDIVSTANNHAWDGGRPAVEETMRRLSERGVLFVGTALGRAMAEQPVIIERRGWRIAFFAVTRAWNPAPRGFYRHAGADYVAWGDPAWILPAIRRLKASGTADLIVVSVHGGEEYQEDPQPQYREFLDELIDAGADLVLGHHPHVLQPVVWHHGKPVVQSLGNFIFLQRDAWTQLSAILRVHVAPGGAMRLSAIPVRAGSQAALASGAAADSIGRRLRLPLSTTRTGSP